MEVPLEVPLEPMEPSEPMEWPLEDETLGLVEPAAVGPRVAG